MLKNVVNIIVIILTLPHEGIVSTIYLISRLIYKSKLRGGLRKHQISYRLTFKRCYIDKY